MQPILKTLSVSTGQRNLVYDVGHLNILPVELFLKYLLCQLFVN